MAPVDSGELQAVLVNDLGRRSGSEKVPIVPFEKGQRKDDVAAENRKKFAAQEGVLFIGKAQEKTSVFRTERRRHEQTGATYPWLVRSTAMVNHFYAYCMDRDSGPFFLKFCTYFPYNAKLCLNGLRPKLAEIMPAGPPGDSPLRAAFDRLQTEIDRCCEEETLVA